MRAQVWTVLLNATRHLRREPKFVSLVVAVLGLALGGTTAMLSIVSGVLLEPLPYADGERLVVVGHRHAERGNVFGEFSPQDFADLAARASSLESSAAFMWMPGQSTINAVIDDRPEQLEAVFATGTFFGTLGASARIGRTFGPDDDKPGNDVAVLADRTWRTLFGADPGVVGRTVRMHGRPFTVLGVLPPEFDYPDARAHVYVPQSFLTEDMVPRQRDVRWMHVVAKVKPGVDFGAARRDIDAALASIAADNPGTNQGFGHAATQQLFEALVGTTRAPLVALTIATLLVLLTACVNLANLMLARAQRRERELATRGALGATPGQLAAQLFAEAALLALLAAVVGFALAAGALDLLRHDASLMPMRSAEVRIDAGVLALGTLLALVTAAAISLLPAWRARRTDPARLLSRGGASTVGRRHAVVRAALVVVQVALVCALGYTTALALESLRRLAGVDMGVAPERVLTFNLSLDGPRYEADRSLARVARRQILDNLRALPGVVSVAGSKNEPIGQTGEGYAFALPQSPDVPIQPDWGVLLVTNDYFRTLGIPLVRGSELTGDESPTTPLVAVVNQAFVDRWLPGQEAVGKRLRWIQDYEIEIVGVAQNARHAGPRADPKPALYMSIDQISRSSLVVTLRTTARGSDIVPLAREAVWSVDRELPIVGMRWLDEQIASLSMQSRLLAIALSAFAMLAALIGGLGVFSLLAYVVGERRRELAIRLAIGERPESLFRSVVAHGAKLAGVGIAIGAPLGLGAARVLQTELYDTSVVEPGVLAGVVAAVALLALAAALGPARNAFTTQPMNVLRSE